jgi:S-adenosylmethionine decarboxylase
MFRITGVIAKLENCKNPDLLRDKKNAISLLKEAAKEIGATVFSEHVYEFNPQGISAVIIVGESHIALHTYPEYNSSYFIATFCKNCDFEKGLQVVIKKLKPEKVEKTFFNL